MKSSIVIITLNSQKYLDEVLSSCKFADEIVIVDSGSTDDTLKIAQKHNANIIQQEWLGFGKQKQFGVNAAKNDWVFVLDSDEIISKELKTEILKTLEKPKFKAYKVARENVFFGKIIKTMGLYPDFSIRFFNKNYAKFNELKVHESVITDEKIGILKNPFKHYAYDNIEQFIHKQNRYSSLGAKNNKLKAIFNPKWTFFKLFILKKGFKEGFDGYLIAKLYSEYTFWKYIKGKNDDKNSRT